MSASMYLGLGYVKWKSFNKTDEVNPVATGSLASSPLNICMIEEGEDPVFLGREGSCMWILCTLGETTEP